MKLAFYRNAAGDEMPCDVVRIAVGSRETGLLSAIWKAASSRSKKHDDIFLTTSGLQNDIKVSFHNNDVIVAFLRERFEDLKAAGTISANYEHRQICSVPVLHDRAWVATEIRFFGGLLRSADRGMPVPADKQMTIIAPPAVGEKLDILGVLSQGGPPELEVDGSPVRWFARVQSGERHLAFYSMLLKFDANTEGEALRTLVSQIEPLPEAAEVANRGDLSMVAWKVHEDRIRFSEIHNIVPTNSGLPKPLASE